MNTKGCENMTAFYIALSSLFELSAIALLIYGYLHEEKVIAWENRVVRKAKCFIRNQLRKSDRIVAWAETPAKHGKPDTEWITGQIKVFGDVWK
jgi:hypothetical protein